MSQSGMPPPAAVQRVPVFQTMREAYTAVFSSLGLLVKAAALPFMLSIVVVILSVFAGGNAFLNFILTVFGFVPYTLFGVAWHRLTLLGPNAAAPVIFPSWKNRHTRFFSYVLVVTGLVVLLVYFLTVAMAGMSGAGGAGAGLVLLLTICATGIGIAYLAMRLSFVFPAVAVDEAYTLANAWTHTRNQGFRLLATLVVTALPVLVAIWVISSVVGWFLISDTVVAPAEGQSAEQALQEMFADNAPAFALLQMILAVLNYLLMAVMVSAISIAFRACTGWVPASTSGSPNSNGGDDGDDGDDDDDGGQTS